ncbi:MAG: peptidoglycan DD-metalloendopeptidase family protein [Frankia sp.]|nr:peptidoglycan DD-metalloendopeptidase family protein [Frankia sp.]
MPSPFRALTRALVTAMCATLVVGVAGPAPAIARTSGDVRAELSALAAKLGEAEAREGVALDRLRKLRREIAASEQTTARARGQLADRMRSIYAGGVAKDSLVVLLTSDDIGRRLDGLAMLDFASRADRRVILDSAVLRRQLQGRLALAEQVQRDLTAARRDLAAGHRRLRALLAQLAAREGVRSRVRASRSRGVDFGDVRGVFACLVGPARAYSDTWGAPRSGGRRHKGTDVMAPYGSPVYAVTNGRIQRTGSGGAGGISIYLRGDNGDVYYYAHNSRNIAHPGQRVGVGQQIAAVGTTGNARGGPAHVHFELHPGGGSPVNPYYFVRRICG